MFNSNRNNRTPGRTIPTPKEIERSTNDKSQRDVRDLVHRRLLAELNPAIATDNVDEVRRALERIFNEVLTEEGLPLSRAERNELFEQIVADILGYGAIEPLLRDDTVTEILVNGPAHVYIERNGLLQEAGITFRDEAEVMRIIDRIVSPLGRRVDESSPMVDARLPDGSRVAVVSVM